MPRFAALPLCAALCLSCLAAADEKEPLDPPTTSDLLVKAREAFRDGRRAEAMQLVNKVLEIDPKNLGGYGLRASMHDLMKQYEKAVADYSKIIELEPDAAGVYQRRGVAHFKAGHIKESIRDFDRFLKENPDEEPHHWMRGISYYYSGEFDKGVRQFEVHKSVNPEDVENAVWHYLCKARIDGVDKAREALIEIKSDSRDWAMSVYEMYRGKKTPEAVLAEAAATKADEARLKNNLFYAHLYVGLYYESLGKSDLAKKHIDLAAEKYLSEHYMGDVARIHAAILKKQAESKSK